MISNSEISALGLFLDIIGVLLLWRFGLPPDIRRSGHSYVLLEVEDESEKKKAKLYDKISHVAILIIVLGFAFQAAGALLPPNAFGRTLASSPVSFDATTHPAKASTPGKVQKP